MHEGSAGGPKLDECADALQARRQRAGAAEHGRVMATLSERLREANREVWNAMQAHRFMRDIEADALPRDVFHRYLAYESAFVETAILIFGHALLKAPDHAARRFLCGVLHGLGGAQLGYVGRAFEALGASPAAPPPLAVTGFDQGMLRIAQSGSYLDILAIMLAGEWMYATWCSRAIQRPITDALVAELVRLHAETDFLAQRDWLMAQLDSTPEVDAATFQRLSSLFGEALRLEIDLHTAPYQGRPA